MKAEELRIGNWIEKNGKQYQASALTIFCLGKDHNPIPLTEDWLIKFGFEKQTEFCGHGINEEMESYNLDGYEFMKDIFNEWFLCGYNWNTKHLSYVHQLQNLYYSLTGKELTT